MRKPPNVAISTTTIAVETDLAALAIEMTTQQAQPLSFQAKLISLPLEGLRTTYRQAMLYLATVSQGMPSALEIS